MTLRYLLSEYRRDFCVRFLNADASGRGVNSNMRDGSGNEICMGRGHKS